MTCLSFLPSFSFKGGYGRTNSTDFFFNIIPPPPLCSFCWERLQVFTSLLSFSPPLRKDESTLFFFFFFFSGMFLLFPFRSFWGEDVPSPSFPLPSRIRKMADAKLLFPPLSPPLSPLPPSVEEEINPSFFSFLWMAGLLMIRTSLF